MIEKEHVAVNDRWPFADVKNAAVFTTRAIFRQEQPILLVTHDEDDGAWCFLGEDEFCEEDALLVALGEVVRRDPSVRELADLPLGWFAWRESIDEPWQRARQDQPRWPELITPYATQPILADDGWELESAEERQRCHPQSFCIPASTARASLQRGDLAKLLFRVAADGEGTECERMWVRVTEVGITGYLGELDNDPIVARMLKAGDLVPFRPEHVADIWAD